MAERTVNVRINYTINTVDIQKATAASNAAQKATDNLRKAADDYAKSAVQGNKSVQDSLKKTQRDTSNLAKDFNGLYSSIRLFLTAGLAKEIFDLSLSMARLSGNVEGVTLAFNRISNATLLLDQLRKATYGTVSDLQLMQRALQAQNFRIPLEKLGVLLEFAAVKAQQTGQEVNHLVDYIVSGIGYRSIKRLDDLGFTANRVRDALGGVSLQAASMGQVMEAVTKLMQEDLQKTGGFAETSATKVGVLERKWYDLKVAVSQALTSPTLLKFYESIVDKLTIGINFLIGGQKKLIEAKAKTQAIDEVNNFRERAITKEILENRQKAYDLIQQEANTNQQIIGRNNDELKTLKERLDLINKYNIGEATRNELYQDRFSLENKNLNERKKTNIEFAETIKAEEDELKTQIGYYSYRNIVLKESIRLLKDYKKSLDVIEENQEPINNVSQGDLVTEKVSFFEIRSSKKPFNERALEQELVDITEKLQQAAKNIPPVKLGVTLYLPPYQDSDWDKITEDFRKNWRGILSQGFSDTAEFLKATDDAELAALNAKLDRLRAFYDDELSMAGDNENAKKNIREKSERDQARVRAEIARKEWNNRRNAILIDTAAGIARNLAEYAWPAWILPVAVTAAQGAAQLAALEKNRPRFAKGVINLQGPGTETSDSIDAKLSKGESVMTAEATRRSMGLLKAIQHNKIDDRILKNIDFSGGGRTVQATLNDDRIVNKLDEIRKSQYDIVEQTGILYKVYKDSYGNKKKIRAMSMGRS